jgi:hypothetical protein
VLSVAGEKGNGPAVHTAAAAGERQSIYLRLESADELMVRRWSW